MSLGQVFISELFGTAVLIVLGVGVVANVMLPKTGGNNGGTLMINFGWGLGVFAGVYVAFKSGAHLNPAVTLGMLADGAKTYAPHVSVTFGSTLTYLAGQFIGAFIGAVLAWMAYKPHFDNHGDAPTNVFSTDAPLRSNLWNLMTEIIATFILVFTILALGKTPSEVGPLAVGMLVVGIGASLGGPTGYAINPARDLSPRLAHFLLPIPNKDNSNWSYAWIPVVGPIIGGVLAGLVARIYI